MSGEKQWSIDQKASKNWYVEDKAKRTVEALKSNGFDAFFAKTKEDALEKILKIIPEGSKVGIAGSLTIREIGIDEALDKRGYKLMDIWDKRASASPEVNLAVRKEGLLSDIFLTGSNAVTEEGELINIDGLGNRVAAMIFGPKKVIIVAGVNKIVKDVYEGIERVRNIAAPMNVIRLKGKTPCSLTGNCDLDECEPPNRHCHIITIIEKRPSKTDATVVIVGENLGF